MKSITRTMVIIPGFDCKHAPCEHETKGDHGISGGEWVYVVSDGDRALSLGVLRYDYPATVPESSRHTLSVLSSRTLANLDLHAKEPWSEWQCEHGARSNCRWLNGAGCYSDGSSLHGSTFFELHGNQNGFNQDEAFWRALEAEFRLWSDARQALPARERVLEAKADGGAA